MTTQQEPRPPCEECIWQAQNQNPVPSSKELILLAELDWHNREERKRLYPMIPWTHGWISGFLSENKPNWIKRRNAAILKEERERILGALDYIEHVSNIPEYPSCIEETGCAGCKESGLTDACYKCSPKPESEIDILERKIRSKILPPNQQWADGMYLQYNDVLRMIDSIRKGES